MPLCTTLILFLQSTCGWAFFCVTPPCVLHLQCPSPMLPLSFIKSTFLCTSSSFPTPFFISNFFLEMKHIPTESYPLYSRLDSPLYIFSLTLLFDMAPIIPHIFFTTNLRLHIENKTSAPFILRLLQIFYFFSILIFICKIFALFQMVHLEGF